MSAKIYGSSLYALSKEEGLQEEILSELGYVLKLFQEHPDYVKILDSPQIDHGELMTVLNDDFFGEINRYTLNFLKLLSEKHMVHHLHECFKEYERLYNSENNITIVDVTTARPLKSELKNRLREKLESKIGGKIIIKEHIDESCIGGIIIETDEKRIDADIKTELDKIKRALTD